MPCKSWKAAPATKSCRFLRSSLVLAPAAAAAALPSVRSASTRHLPQRRRSKRLSSSWMTTATITRSIFTRFRHSLSIVSNALLLLSYRPLTPVVRHWRRRAGTGPFPTSIPRCSLLPSPAPMKLRVCPRNNQVGLLWLQCLESNQFLPKTDCYSG